MQLSILLPTNKHNMTAISRIAQACSWANPSIEVIVRDNSGNMEKRELLKHFQREHCTIITADPCGPRENMDEILNLAKGDFIFYVADDDQYFDRAIAALPDMIDLYGRDPTIVGFAGHYAIEWPQCSTVFSHKYIDSDDIITRVIDHVYDEHADVIFYSALRRELVKRINAFARSLPFEFPFHSQLQVMLYTLNGKFHKLQRLFYAYDIANSAAPIDIAQKYEIGFYSASGLDPAIHKLNWFLMGFEGALLAMTSDDFPDIPVAQREIIAQRWFDLMHSRFKTRPRLSFGSPLDEEADKLCNKLRATNGQLSFQDALSIISNFIALSSKANAEKYFDFWSAMINRRRATLHQTGI